MKFLFALVIFILLTLFLFFGRKGLLKNQKTIIGGIVPHHLVADFMIDDFFRKLAPQKPKTIVVFGPNHLEKGKEDILFGETYNEIVQNENSIKALMPYIDKYLPETKVVPLILKKNCSRQKIEKTADYLISSVSKDTVFIASVDFSHYLTMEEAWQKDEDTLKAIKNKEYDYLLSLNSEYLDSPASIVLLLKIMEKKDKNNMTILKHTNSGEILKSEAAPVTSYFEIAFE